MKNIHHSNLVFYFTVIASYLYNPILGAIFQFGLGVFQLIIAIIIKINSNKLTSISKSLINYYWLSILIWIIVIISSSMNSYLESNFKLLLLIIPMMIGFYLVIVSYISTKTQES